MTTRNKPVFRSSSAVDDSWLNRRIIWLAVVLRVGVYVFLHFSMGIAVSGSGLIGKRGGDTASYFDPIDNLLDQGHYASLLEYLPSYAGRMPGYGAVYGLFRLLQMPKTMAYDALILSQMGLALVSLYYLGKLAYAVTQRRQVAYAVMLIHALSPYGAQPDLALLTESFAASSLIIGTYYCLSAIKTSRRRHLLVAGGWLTWVVFLRPYMAPLLGIWPAVYIFYHSGAPSLSRRQLGMNSLLLVLPFAVIDGAWTARNFLVLKQFIPLQLPYAGLVMSADYLEARRFAAALGEDPVEWNSASLMSWLIRPAAAPQAAPQPWQLTQHGTHDSLVWVRQRIQAAQPASSPPAAAALRRFHDAVVQERPFLYYVVAPLRLTYYLVLTGGGTSIFAWPFGELAFWQKAIRLFFTFTHWLLMGASLCSYFWWPRPMSAGWLLVCLPPIFVVLLFVVGLRYVESRYFIEVYPLALLSGVVALARVAERLSPRLFPH